MGVDMEGRYKALHLVQILVNFIEQAGWSAYMRFSFKPAAKVVFSASAALRLRAIPDTGNP